jgi:predicted nucleic acid-binding protein
LDGYLLDNNIINYWHNAKVPEHALVTARIAALPADTPLRVSAIVIGEIEDGMRRALSPTEEAKKKHRELRVFLRQNFPRTLPVTEQTSVLYGEIRSRIFRHCYPGFSGRQGKSPRPKKRPEEWVNPATSSELGIEENDIWIAAQAAETNLIFVTHDGMANIRAVVNDLVKIVDWAA